MTTLVSTNLHPTFVLTHVDKPVVTGDCWWDVVVSPHACFRVLLGASGASLCTLLVGWSRDQDGSLTAVRVCQC